MTRKGLIFCFDRSTCHIANSQKLKTEFESSLICHFVPTSASIENHFEKIKVLAVIKSQKMWLCVLLLNCAELNYVNQQSHIYCLCGGVMIWYPTFLTVWTWKYE